MSNSVFMHDSFGAFINPNTTNPEIAKAEAFAAQHALVIPGAPVEYFYGGAEPANIAQIVDMTTDQSLALVYSGGGDGTVNKVESAIIGHVQDDPEATANNFMAHRRLIGGLVYLAGAGGNGRNLPISALGKHADYPSKISSVLNIGVGYQRPVLYEVTDEQQSHVRSGVVTGGIGVGDAAVALVPIEAYKPRLATVPKSARLAAEGALIFNALLKAAPFSAELTLTDQTQTGQVVSETRQLNGITGVEMIGCRSYAKQGKTPVNINDLYQQIVIAWGQANSVTRSITIADAFARLSRNKHRLPPINFADKELRLRVTSDQPVPFHSDGEIGRHYIIEPGQTLRLKLARLCIPIYMLLK